MQFFITAIGTDSGKSLVSAIFVEALKADYWKPIQAGFPRDTDTVQALVSNKQSAFYSEAYLLSMPASPHAAASQDGERIDLSIVVPPKTSKDLIVEGAGGVLVPVNDHDFVIDMPQQWKMPVVLVSNHYLGSINHTLLTVNELKRRNIEVVGIVFNGEENKESESIILKHSGYKTLLKIPQLEKVDKETVKKYAEELRKNL
ncbi:dethiobiotin synthase [Limibacter armeniacum]|uniref:dethiobiotin synthase n=1 Tax=Limibacter armeniacum TaxID=466084 RepID=UPI002FE501D0